MQMLLSVTKFETFRKKAEEQSYPWFQFEQNTKMLFIHCCIFYFSPYLVLWSLVGVWFLTGMYTSQCAENAIQCISLPSLHKFYIFFYISARGYDKTDYCLKNYFIHLCSIIFFVVLCTLWKNIIYDID